MRAKALRGAMLHLTEEDVEGLLTMNDALREVEAALRDLGNGKAENRPRQRVRGTHAILNLMPGSWPGRGYCGFKDYTASKEGVRFWFHLFDGETGAPVAVIQANRLGQQRTGAASGVATKFLARPDASTVGIIGTGWQAESQLEALCAVRSIRSIRCHSPQEPRSQAFAKTMSKKLGVDVTPTASPQEVVRDADIVVVATSASHPVILGEWIEPGVHLNAIGANRLDARELDDETIRRCAFISVDSIEQARLEAGDLVKPIASGLLRWESIHEIASVVCGKEKGRSRETDVTLFKSLGLALEDVAVGSLVYERAREEGIGTEVTL